MPSAKNTKTQQAKSQLPTSQHDHKEDDDFHQTSKTGSHLELNRQTHYRQQTDPILEVKLRIKKR